MLSNMTVLFSGNSLIFSRKMIISSGFLSFLPVLRPDASAPVVVKNSDPTLCRVIGVWPKQLS